MIYNGDTYVFTLSLTRTDGANPTVTATPSLQIINARTGIAVFGSGQSMALIPNTQKIYQYAWAISGATNDDYVAIVSYTVDGVTVTARFLEKIRLGDANIVGKVALDSTVAKDATVAKDSTVAKSADLAAVNPNSSSVVLAIKAKTDNLPADPASATLVTSVLSMLTDVKDAELGSIVINKTASPKTMTLKRPDNSVLATFTLTEDDSQTTKTLV